MDVQKIKELALANGFSLKEQASGNMDLHSYVYEFANAIEQAAKAQAVPEGFVLVEKTKLMQIVGSAAIIEPITRGNPLMSKYKTELEFILSTVRAMIEAQEQSHENG